MRNTLSLGLIEYLLYHLEHIALPLNSPCHPERSEGSEEQKWKPLLGLRHRILRCAQDDKARLVVKLSAQDGKEAHPKLHIITQNKDIRLRNTLSLGLNKYLLYYLEHSALPLTVPCHPERSEGSEEGRVETASRPPASDPSLRSG